LRGLPPMRGRPPGRMIAACPQSRWRSGGPRPLIGCCSTSSSRSFAPSPSGSRAPERLRPTSTAADKRTRHRLPRSRLRRKVVVRARGQPTSGAVLGPSLGARVPAISGQGGFPRRRLSLPHRTIYASAGGTKADCRNRRRKRACRIVLRWPLPIVQGGRLTLCERRARFDGRRAIAGPRGRANLKGIASCRASSRESIPPRLPR
jgi:hypothetical protein